jgi:hypothetical protein
MKKTTNTTIMNHGRTMEMRMTAPKIEENVEANMRNDSIENQ